MVIQVDTLLNAGWIIPVRPDPRGILNDHSIAIQDGRIFDILPHDQAATKYSSNTILDRHNCIVTPGFINTHTHTGMTLMRGRGDDMGLLEWLHQVVWPIEGEFAHKEEFCYDGAMLAICEMIRGGITCFADMYWSPDAAARAVIESGIRGIIGMIVIAFPSKYASNVDEYLEKGHKAMKKYKEEDRLSFVYAPHAPYTVGTKTWEKLKQLSEENGLKIHTHLHETKDECEASAKLDRDNGACHMSDRKCHPVEDFNEMGLLNDRLVAVHMVHLNDEEIELCGKRGVSVAHCPSSNSKLGSGFCGTHKLIEHGVNVGLGTDSAVSNNSLSMFDEMKLAGLNAKNISGDATSLPAWQVLEMATINGAKMYGLQDEIGSLEKGKRGDLICIECETRAGNTPMFNAHAGIVYAGNDEDVCDVFVNGNMILRDKKYVNMDLLDVIRRAKYWRKEIERMFPMKK